MPFKQHILIMAATKHQCLARLDEVELDKLDVIRSISGLSRSGAIRRLIRDFNIEPNSDKPVSKFIVDGQISKDIFLQLPVRHPLWFSAVRNPKTHKLEIKIYDGVDIVDDVIICGYINYPELVKSSVRDNYMHDILYLCNDRLYKDTQFTHAGEDIDILREYSRVEECLNQIFVV